jgi:outer membrane cobalamin receptor
VFFHNDVCDLISFEQVRPGKFRAFNVGSARITGHEVSVAAEVLDHVGLDLNYTHQNAENRDVDSPEGNQLPLRPSDELFVRPRVFAAWGSLYYEFTFLGDNPTDTDNFVTVPSRTIHTIGGTVKPLSWLTARLEIANLADADVRDLGDFPLPGLSVFGGLKAVF